MHKYGGVKEARYGEMSSCSSLEEFVDSNFVTHSKIQRDTEQQLAVSTLFIARKYISEVKREVQHNGLRGWKITLHHL